MTQHNTAPTPSPEANAVTSLITATAAEQVPWTKTGPSRLCANGSQVTVILDQDGPLTTLTVSAGAPHIFGTDSDHQKELPALMQLAFGQAKTRRTRLHDLSQDLFGDIPDREIPKVEDDPDATWRIVNAAVHATQNGTITWSPLDTPSRITMTAATGTTILQLDVLVKEGPAGKPILLFTATSEGRPLATCVERHDNLRDDWPLLALLRAANGAAQHRRADAHPWTAEQGETPSLSRLISTFLKAVS